MNSGLDRDNACGLSSQSYKHIQTNRLDVFVEDNVGPASKY